MARVVGFHFTNEAKAEIIENLALAFERGEVALPKDETLIGELEAFESTRLPGGGIRYAAPSGMHDDMVMSLALAWSNIRRRFAYG